MIVPISVEEVRRMAHIIGPSGAYARALERYEECLAQGFEAAFYRDGHKIIVGPPLAATRQQEGE
jgi:hypothetical protein